MLRRFPGVVLELRTARANGIPHSTLRRGPTRKYRHRWTPTDRILALALTTHEDGLCGGCGQPRDRSWNADMEGEYETHRVMCQGCQALHLENDARPRGAAETVWVTDETPDGYEPDPRMFPKL